MMRVYQAAGGGAGMPPGGMPNMPGGGMPPGGMPGQGAPQNDAGVDDLD